ncbi:AAA ATPase domain-containing protein [Frankineae bacterium MT45]|nr:AAA ATPase domain-containing protein [Frankineae bacterium MT45]
MLPSIKKSRFDTVQRVTSHDDNLRRLDAKFNNNNRYANFGPALQSLDIDGFRGVNQLHLNIESPVTALSGLNGTGKSTIAQLATCGYRAPLTSATNRYYVKDFFPVSAADPAPFTPDARIVYAYCVERGADLQQVTVTRAVKEWAGYKRQPERACYYIGFTQFIPKVERRDFSVYRGRSLLLGDSRPLSEEASAAVGRILSLPYESLEFTDVSHRSNATTLAMATRNGRRYSENHMGFGEGRVVYMVNTMETAPAQSLFVLEEPETSLHGDAQRRLAHYFVEVSSRRGHQVILTTHSSAILGELSRESKIYLHRGGSGVLGASHGLSTYQIDSYLIKQRPRDGAVTLCVEDAFGRYLAIEILRKVDAHMLAGCNVLPVGSCQEVVKAVALLRLGGLRTAGLVDGDAAKEATADGVSRLPGTNPPEKEVFRSQAVKDLFANAPYSVSIDEILATQGDHHGYVRAIADHLMLDQAVVATQACRAYVDAIADEAVAPIADFFRTQFTDNR